MPFVRQAIVLGGTLVFMGMCLLVYSTWANLNSRNIALGLGAALGAILALAIQLTFELRNDIDSQAFNVEYTVDARNKRVAQWAYHSQQLTRAVLEMQAQQEIDWTKDPQIEFFGEAKIFQELATVSFMAMYIERLPRWDVAWRTTNLRNGSFSTFAPSSGQSECTNVSVNSIKDQLTSAGNRFADLLWLGPYVDRNICLPPASTITVGLNSILIRTRACQLLFKAGDTQGGDTLDPKMNAPSARLDNGMPQYITSSINLSLTRNVYWWLSQSKSADECKQWNLKVEDEARKWFKQVSLAEYRSESDKNRFIMPLYDGGSSLQWTGKHS